MTTETKTQIFAVIALAAILIAGGLYADKVYVPPQPPPEVVQTQHGPVQIARDVQPGDLITAPDLQTVYYLNSEGKRVVFPDVQTFLSWYPDFSQVKYLHRDRLESYPLSGRNVTIRPGTYLVTIQSSNQVWTVGFPRDLHWLKGGEEQVQSMFGDNWQDRVVDLPEYYFVNYTEADSSVDTWAYPIGQLIHLNSDDRYYLVSYEGLRLVSDEGMQANHFNPKFAVNLDQQPDSLSNGPDLNGYEVRWGSPDSVEEQGGGNPQMKADA